MTRAREQTTHRAHRQKEAPVRVVPPAYVRFDGVFVCGATVRVKPSEPTDMLFLKIVNKAI